MVTSRGAAWIIIVDGPPCSGKSRVAAALGRRLGLPLLTKDALKERLFETLGWGDAERADDLNRAANALLLDVARLLLATGRPFVLESNLRPDRDGAVYAELQQQWGFEAIQLHCSAAPELLIERFRRRWAAGLRHPGHADDRTEAAVAERIRAGVYGPLALRGPLMRVDTSDAGYVNVERLAASALRQAQAIEGATP